jgi:hypothetical protein
VKTGNRVRPPSDKPRQVKRTQRYRHLIESGAESKRASDASHSPVRYAEYIAELGEQPIPELSEIVLGGRARVDTEEAREFKRRYHQLRALGQSAIFCSEYGRSEVLYKKGLRIIAGESE